MRNPDGQLVIAAQQNNSGGVAITQSFRVQQNVSRVRFILFLLYIILKTMTVFNYLYKIFGHSILYTGYMGDVHFSRHIVRNYDVFLIKF